MPAGQGGMTSTTNGIKAMTKFNKTITYVLAAAAFATLIVVFLQSTSMLASS